MEGPEGLKHFSSGWARTLLRAVRRYEEVRQKLIYIFRYRGGREAEELAGETLDQTARAIARLGFAYVGDPITYFRRVAHKVHLEAQDRELLAVRQLLLDGAKYAADPIVVQDRTCVEIRSEAHEVIVWIPPTDCLRSYEVFWREAFGFDNGDRCAKSGDAKLGRNVVVQSIAMSPED